MRPKLTTVFVCQACGAGSAKWLGRCPDCGEWNSYVEEVRSREPQPATATLAAAPLTEVAVSDAPRIGTHMPGVDRVLGGGLVPGSVVLLGGEPGIGKSTLLLQVARSLSAAGGDVLYATAEESAAQIRIRADRLGIREERLAVLAETEVARVV